MLRKMTEFCKRKRDTDIEAQEKALVEEFKTEAFKSIAGKFLQIRNDDLKQQRELAELQEFSAICLAKVAKHLLQIWEQDRQRKLEL